MTLLSSGPKRSRDKLKSLHLYYNSAYGRQTSLAGDFPWRASIYVILLHPLVTRSNNPISISTLSMAINFGRMEIYIEEFPFLKVTISFDCMVLQCHVNYFSCCITTTTRPITTKLGRMLTYYKKLQSIKSHSLLKTWSRESHDKLKSFYLHYHNTYGYQTWEGGYIQ